MPSPSLLSSRPAVVAQPRPFYKYRYRLPQVRGIGCEGYSLQEKTPDLFPKPAKVSLKAESTMLPGIHNQNWRWAWFTAVEY